MQIWQRLTKTEITRVPPSQMKAPDILTMSSDMFASSSESVSSSPSLISHIGGIASPSYFESMYLRSSPVGSLSRKMLPSVPSPRDWTM